VAAVTALAPAAATEEAAPSADPTGLDQLLQRLATRRHGHVSFTEVHEYAMLNRPLESSGELLYDAPDRLEKRTLAPKAETLVLAAGVVTVQRGRRHYSFELREHPELLPLIESIRATLAGDRAALERYFRVEFEGDPAHWRLRLVPRDTTLARSVRQLRIEGAGDVLSTVEIQQADGDRSRLTIGPELAP
jgi:hypothetical protein